MSLFPSYAHCLPKVAQLPGLHCNFGSISRALLLWLCALLGGVGAIPAWSAGPVITSQPQKWVARVGSDHTFSVTATGSPPLSYQWRHDDTVLSGATASTLLLSNIQLTDAGYYDVVVTDGQGTSTSSPVELTVRGADEPYYPTPQGGWSYFLNGNQAASSGTAALDGGWNHNNPTDSWSGDGRGPLVGLPGGIGTTNGILTFEDAVTTGSSDVDNRRFYLTRSLGLDAGITNADLILDTGVTLSFRARLTPSAATDPNTELGDAPNGLINLDGGKGMFGLRQAGAGSGGGIISFSLSRAVEDTGPSTTFNLGTAGLHMNSLFGNATSPFVNPDGPGTRNILALDPAQWHEFWITIQTNGPDAGTHRVRIYVDGSLVPSVFNVTSGTGAEAGSSNYLALGLGGTAQRGAFDLDFFGYKQGIVLPHSFNEPVTFVTQPSDALSLPGATASFEARVDGTPPISFQWYSDNQLLVGATNVVYTTPALTAQDDNRTFTLVASNHCGSITSRVAVLDMLLPPTIVEHPQSIPATNGDTVTFSVRAQSSGAMTFQWRHQEQSLTGQISSNLTLVQTSLAHTGRYDVVVGNDAGAVTSQVAILTIDVFDFGDAPDFSRNYHTVLTNNGARHRVVAGYHLGASVDWEFPGWRDALALGDDAMEGDDEDGIEFPEDILPGQLAMVKVVASGPGVLNAWMDFAGNGSWLDATDQVFTNVALNAGTNLLSFLVPAAAPEGFSYGRFRFSTGGDATFTGPSHDGEVEDHRYFVGQRVDLTVAATAGPLPIAAGSNLTYTITVTNLGRSATSLNTVEATLPPGAIFVTGQTSQGAGCILEGGVVRCTLVDLAPGGTANATIVVKIPNAGLATNQIFAYAGQYDENFADNSVSVVTLIEAPPVVVAQPVNRAAPQGATVQFSAAASGAAPLYYQWLHDGTVVADATAATLTLVNIQPSDLGTYALRVSNHVGLALSQPATLTFIIAPSITQEPGATNRFAGSSVIFTVAASGTAPFTYRWFFQGTNLLVGVTNATLSLTNLRTAQMGSYHAEVSNSAGTAISASAYLDIEEVDFGDAPDLPYPTLLDHDGAYHRLASQVFLGAGVSYEADGRPHAAAAADADDGVTWSEVLLVGTAPTLQVVASTNGLLDAWIDWDGDGSWGGVGEHLWENLATVAGTNRFVINIPAGAKPGLTFARFRFRTAGTIGVSGRAMNGEVEDYALTIQGAADLVANISSASSIVTLGSNYQCVVTISNAGPSAADNAWLEYTPAPGAVLVSATAAQGSCTNMQGILRCDFASLSPQNGAAVIVTMTPNVRGLHTNRVVAGSAVVELQPNNNTGASVLMILEPPVITQQPASRTATNSGSASFSVQATGDELRYQWFFAGTPLTQATNATLIIAPVLLSHAGEYTVVVSNRAVAVLSQAATLTVVAPPAIMTQPRSQVAVAGTNLTLEVVVSGTEPLRYLWRFNGADLPGATNAAFTVLDVQPDDQGSYQVWIVNDVGSAISDPASLTVVLPASIVVPPMARSVLAGRSATLTVEAMGTGTLSYQWYFEGNLIAGANSAELTLPVAETNAAGYYSVTVSNAFGMATSSPVLLSVLPADFGDAPDPDYPTLAAHNGAYHIIRPNFHLGARVDHEPDGFPSMAAVGDDTSGSDDEDGVRFPTPVRQGQIAQVEVVASAPGFLDAWIDLDINGLWLEAGEQIFSRQAVTAGTNRLWFGVTPTAVLSTTQARFRFSTAGGLAVTGRAEDGEVEDYLVAVEAPFDLGLRHTQITPEVVIGSALTFTLEVSNHLGLAATGVRLTNALPRNVTFVQASTTQGSCVQTNGVVICDLGGLPGGAAATVAVLVIPQQGGALTNIAWLAANEFDPETLNNSSEAVTRVVGSAGPFRRNDPINMSATGPADLYPSTIVVSGVASIVDRLTVTISNLSHSFPDDIDILLVGPNGTNVLLMSDAGGGVRLTDVTLIFSDAASLVLPNTGGISSGSVRPSNFDTTTDALPPSAPAGPYGRTLSVFNGTNPNGTWTLYVQDDEDDDFGVINDGWSLQITTLGPLADLATSGQATPNPVAVGTNLTYTFSVHNAGPSAATGVVWSDEFPPGFEIINITSSQGSCSNVGGVVTCALGSMANGASASIQVTALPMALGLITNGFSVHADQLDIHQDNNRNAVVTSVESVTDMTLTLATLPNAITLGETLQYDFHVSNPGVGPVTEVVFANSLAPHAALVSVLSTQGTCTNDNGVLRCALGTIASGGSAEIHFVVQPNRLGTITNFAVVSAREFDITEANNRIRATTAVETALPSLRFSDALVVPTLGTAAPYPAVIPVSGVTGTVERISVTLSNIQHGSPADLDILLVGPQGQAVMLCSDAGGDGPVTDITLIFSDAAGAGVTTSGPLASGLYRPTNLESTDDFFPAPAPTGTFGSALAAFHGTDPNGNWSLYILDDTEGNSGVMAGGWGLEITLAEPLADVSVSMTAFPARVAVGSNLLYSIVIRNEGPGDAYGVTLRDSISGMPQFLGISSSQGSWAEREGVLEFQLGTLAAHAQADLTVLVRPMTFATVESLVTVASLSLDLLPTNNAVSIMTPVGEPPVVLTRPSSQVALGGSTVTLSVVVSGDSPFQYQWLFFGTNIVGATNADLILQNVSRTDIGTYSARIFNAVGSTLSGAAMLQVLEPPVMSAILDQFLDEDSVSGVIPFTVDDFEPPVDNLLIDMQTSDADLFPPGSLLLSGNGSSRALTLVPAPNRSGSATLSISVVDSDDLEAVRSFSVTVREVNDAPSLSPISDQQLAQNGVRLIPIVVGDLETAPSELTLFVTASDTVLFPAGAATSSGNGSERTIILAPAQQQTGSAVITVRVRDGHMTETTNTFLVTVAPNTPPVISAISPQQTLEDVAVPDVGFVIGDQETVAEALQVSVESSHPTLFPPAHLVLSGTGSNRVLHLTPRAQVSGNASITVTVEDASGVRAMRTFDVTVLAQNDRPTLSGLADQTMRYNETIHLPVALRDEETSGAGLVLRAQSANQSRLPDAGIQLAGSGPNRILSLTPALNATGSVMVTYWVEDPENLKATNTFALTIVRPIEPPVITTQPRGVVVSNGANVSLTAVVAGSTPLSYQWRRDDIPLAGGTNITLPLNAIQATNAGSYSLFVSNAAGSTVSIPALVQVDTQTSSVQAPTLSSLPDIVVLEDSGATLSFTVNDPDSPVFALLLGATSSNPGLIADSALRFEGNGSARTLRVDPVPNMFGSAVVTVSVSDGSNTILDSFAVTVVPVNDPPTLDELPPVRLVAGAGDFDVFLSGISRGPTNETSGNLTVIASTADSGIVTIRSRTYSSPSPTGLQKIRGGSVPGMANVTVSVSDSMPSNNVIARPFTAFVSLSANALPTVSSIAPQLIAEDSVAGPLSFTVSDAESPANQITNRVRSSNQALLPDSAIQISGTGATRTLTARPLTNQTGTTTVSLDVFDAGYSMISTSFTLTVQPVNDLPVVSPIPDHTVAQNGVTPVIPFTVSDLETPAAHLSVTASSSDPMLVPLNKILLGGSGTNRALRITPATGRSGVALITVRVSDGTTNQTSNFTLTVTGGGNAAPVLSDLANVQIFEDTATPPLAFVVADDLTPLPNLRVTGLSSDTSLVPLSNIVFSGSGSTRTVVVTPLPNAFGSAVITVQVEDEQGVMVWDHFILTVHPVNDLPGFDPLPSVVLNSENGPLVVPVTGIRAGPANEVQALALSAISSAQTLLADPVVEYAPGQATGVLTLSAVGTNNGTATVTVALNDGQLQNNLAVQQFQVTVQVLGLPVIVEQPRSQRINFGEPVMLHVRATGAGSLSYQWFHDGVPVPGATRDLMTIASSAAADLGSYWVEVRNAAGTTTSATANLSAGVEIVEIAVGPSVTVRFTTSAGQLHTLEYADVVGPGATWMSLGNLIGDGTVRALTDPAPPMGMRWYRIRTD